MTERKTKANFTNSKAKVTGDVGNTMSLDKSISGIVPTVSYTFINGLNDQPLQGFNPKPLLVSNTNVDITGSTNSPLTAYVNDIILPKVIRRMQRELGYSLSINEASLKDYFGKLSRTLQLVLSYISVREITRGLNENNGGLDYIEDSTDLPLLDRATEEIINRMVGMVFPKEMYEYIEWICDTYTMCNNRSPFLKIFPYNYYCTPADGFNPADFSTRLSSLNAELTIEAKLAQAFKGEVLTKAMFDNTKQKYRTAKYDKQFFNVWYNLPVSGRNDANFAQRMPTYTSSSGLSQHPGFYEEPTLKGISGAGYWNGDSNHWVPGLLSMDASLYDSTGSSKSALTTTGYHKLEIGNAIQHGSKYVYYYNPVASALAVTYNVRNDVMTYTTIAGNDLIISMEALANTFFQRLV